MTRKEAARINRNNKATRYATVIVWMSGAVEDSMAYGSIRNALAWAKKYEARADVAAVHVYDRKPAPFARHGWL